MKPREVGHNIARLLNAVGSWINLETYSGSIREGRLSGWTCITFRLNGVDVHYPTLLELNGDPQDVVRLTDIRKLDIQERKTR